MVFQLSVLGCVLGPIFAYNRCWLVLGYGGIMTAIAALEAMQRPAHMYKVGRAGERGGGEAIQRLPDAHTYVVLGMRAGGEHGDLYRVL